MIRASLACLALLTARAPLAAQVFPTPGPETPRIQSAPWRAGEPLVLTALPQTALTVMLEPGERIQRATLSGSGAWQVAISAEEDSFQITPGPDAMPASLSVETDRRAYSFLLETGDGLQAAYLVRLQFAPAQPAFQSPAPAQTFADALGELTSTWRLRGDQAVRPVTIRDDGVKTVIEYAPGQALPAVFAIGPTGAEEVVDGYMRDGLFIIDRVHQQLVFRIDRAKATATRSARTDAKRADRG
jgi:type IV secretion system protein VirB9